MGKIKPGFGKGRLTAKRESEVLKACKDHLRESARKVIREGMNVPEAIEAMNAYTTGHGYYVADYPRLSRLSKTELSGYRDALMSSFADRTVWCLRIDGKLMSREEYNALGKREREVFETMKGLGLPVGEPVSVYDSKRCDSAMSAHCWLDEKGNVRKDRPYNVPPKDCKYCGFPAEEHHAREKAGGCQCYHSS